MKSFQKIPHLEVFPPQGAFYLWVGVKNLYGCSWKGGIIQSSKDFVNALWEEKAVLCVPGEEFNYPGYVRIHFAIPKERLLMACSRVEEFIKELK